MNDAIDPKFPSRKEAVEIALLCGGFLEPGSETYTFKLTDRTIRRSVVYFLNPALLPVSDDDVILFEGMTAAGLMWNTGRAQVLPGDEGSGCDRSFHVEMGPMHVCQDDRDVVFYTAPTWRGALLALVKAHMDKVTADSSKEPPK
jgi:hypothetical protein